MKIEFEIDEAANTITALKLFKDDLVFLLAHFKQGSEESIEQITKIIQKLNKGISEDLKK